MDNGMRKELEEALVDELAKNLGETIDNTDITEEDLEKLIEEGFDEVGQKKLEEKLLFFFGIFFAKFLSKIHSPKKI